MLALFVSFVIVTLTHSCFGLMSHRPPRDVVGDREFIPYSSRENNLVQVTNFTLNRELLVPVDTCEERGQVMAMAEHAGFFVNNHSSLVTWGWDRKSQGILGFGSSINLAGGAASIEGMNNISKISAHTNHACAVKDDTKTAWCWGSNEFGQTGQVIGQNTFTPAEVTSIDNVIDVSTGLYHTCLLRSELPYVYCMGRNNYGQVGNGIDTNDSTRTPQAVSGLPSNNIPRMIESGFYGTCVVFNTDDETDQIYCWGSNEFGGIGLPAGVMTSGTALPIIPASFDGSRKVVSISLGKRQGCFVTLSGQVACFGLNNYGIISPSLSTTKVIYQPSIIAEFRTDTIDIKISSRTVFLLKVNGTAWAYGYNENGQLGVGHNETLTNGGFQSIGYPNDIIFSSIQISEDNGCASIASTNSLLCWGENANFIADIQGDTSNDILSPARVDSGNVICTNPIITSSPSEMPTNSPTKGPTNYPTKEPTDYPTKEPTSFPTKNPTTNSTLTPSLTQTVETDNSKLFIVSAALGIPLISLMSIGLYKHFLSHTHQIIYE